MRIGIHASDLDNDRIDGTRVYIWNILKHLGNINKEDEFFIYHGKKFNSRLTPSNFDNYNIKSLPKAISWTQTVFSKNIKQDKLDFLWMPVQNIPLLKSKKIKTTVTIHDLAFKRFPKFFPLIDRIKLNILANISINRSDKIIAISNSTKKDILNFFPKIEEKKITVVYNGFDKEFFSKKSPNMETIGIMNTYKIDSKKYFLYVGAIQPRKNLNLLIDAFEKIKTIYPEYKLVFAGALAWKEKGILKKIKQSVFRNDIIITGTIPFQHQPALYQNAKIFIFPSLYEGFGIPILEAFASSVPVICANNSSLPEVAGDSCLYFNTYDSESLVSAMKNVLENEILCENLIASGLKRSENFSWEKCAKETLDVILN